MKALPLLVAALLTGCLSAPPAGDPEEWYLGGSFTTERTEEDIAAVCEAGAGTSECAIMESYPEQFGFRFASQPECAAARDRILLIPHVVVRECVRIVPDGDPDAPTSSAAGGGSPA